MSQTPPPASGEPQATPPPAAAGTPAAPAAAPSATPTPAPAGTPAPAAGTPAGTPSPIVYALKAPEGSLLKPEAIERTTAHVAKLGLSPEHAQAVLEQTSAEVKAYHTAIEEQSWKMRTVDWVDQVKNDPEIGGAKFETETVPAIARAMAKYSDPEFTEMLAQTKLGNHPGLSKFIARVGRSLADDKLITAPGSPPSEERKPTTEVMWGKKA